MGNIYLALCGSVHAFVAICVCFERTRFILDILNTFLKPERFLLSCCCICLYNLYTCIKVRYAKAISTITWFTISHSLAKLTLDSLMFGSSHFRRGLWALRLMLYQIKGDVKINTVQRQLYFPLECSKWQSFYVGEKAFQRLQIWQKCSRDVFFLYGFKTPLC